MLVALEDIAFWTVGFLFGMASLAAWAYWLLEIRGERSSSHEEPSVQRSEYRAYTEEVDW